MTVIKSLIIPKLVYISSLLPTPKGIIQELNRLLFKFLWKGTDKVTRLSAINEYENGGLKMIDLESMIQSLRLAWIKRTFEAHDSIWKSYLRHLLNRFGGLFLFHCNYDVKDIPITSQFYSELLKWWSDFREEFDTERDRQNIVWNNKEIRINNKPVFYKNFFESGIIYVSNLLFHLNNTDSFNIISQKISRTNVLIWAGLRHSVPSYLKTTNCISSTTPLSFRIDNKGFDAMKKKSKDYYILIKSRKAQLPNNSRLLKHDFNLTDDQLKEVFILPHNLAFEPYVKAFQYEILNSILYTNSKLYKIGYTAVDKCSFCELEPKTLPHLFFHCVYSQLYWKRFESYYYSLTKEFVHFTLQDILIGIITSKCPLLNYLLLIAKVYLWDCRRSKMLPNIIGPKLKVKNKYETEKYICIKNNTIEKFTRKWALTSGSVLQ